MALTVCEELAFSMAFLQLVCLAVFQSQQTDRKPEANRGQELAWAQRGTKSLSKGAVLCKE
jgi:hypothetical protein